MGLLLRWIGKNAVLGIFWLFILSIQFQGRPLYFTAHETIIQNDIVIAMDYQLQSWWDQLSEKASSTIAKWQESDEKSPTY